MMSKEQYKMVGLTSLGGALEFYDFTIYALFSPYLSQHFFASSTPVIALINTFAIFALGYLSRPLGGLVFGHFGDKFGRKSAFSLAIFLMALSTLLMGCLPSYQTIGIAAPIILMSLRLVQGFSVGGEIPGAAVFTIEHVPQEKRGFSIGLVFMSITLGNTLGALVGFGLSSYFDAEQMTAWGWRIPFIIGFFLGFISYLIRRKAIETPLFLAMIAEKKSHRIPFLELLKFSRQKIMAAVLLTALTSSVISFFLYLPTYLSTIVKINISYSYLINFVSFLSFGLLTAFFGWFSDKVNRVKLLTIGATCLVLFTYPLFRGLDLFGEYFVWFFVLSIALFASMVNGTYVVLITESFSTDLRYSGVGFSYSLGVALFGGIAPLAFTAFIQWFNSAEAPALYILICSLLTLIAARVFLFGYSKYRQCDLIYNN